MVRVWEEEKVEFVGAESLIGKSVRFRPDFYTIRIMPPSDWTGTIVEERRSSSGQGISSYIVLLDEPFRSQEPDPRVDATEDELETVLNASHCGAFDEVREENLRNCVANSAHFV